MRHAWLATLCCLIVICSARIADGQLSEWRSGVPNDLFKDDQISNKPTHRLAPAPSDCPQCQADIDKLQAALDDWYALQLADAEQNIRESMLGNAPGSTEKQKAAREQKADALAGLGQNVKAPPAGKTKAGVKADIAKLLMAVRKCLDDCKPKTAEEPQSTATPTPGPLALPSDPFKVREEQQREAEKQLDPCLIGTWRSKSVEVTLLNEKGGGEGIVITIGEDHSVTIDYTVMTPMSGGHAKNVWQGIASGHMWASKGRGGITSMERAEAYLITNGRRNPQSNYKDLGPAKIMRYECNETTLITESVTHKITYTRQKE